MSTDSSIRIDKALHELAEWSGMFVEDPLARRFLINQLKPLFSDLSSLKTFLMGEAEWNDIRELAAAGLHAAELEGNLEDQRLFLHAICHLAPVSSPQFRWANRRLDSLG